MVARQWQDYWASGGTGERALGDPAERATLAQHWRTLFAAHARAGAVVVDIACGDGIVFAAAREQLSASGATLVALDAAPAAARAAMGAASGVLGAAADACRLPLQSGGADVVVSQFGLEYGGWDAFAEAARILKPGAVLSAICHFKGGRIDAECAENARVLRAFASEALGKHARAALAATYARGPTPPSPKDKSFDAKFQRAAKRVGATIADAPDSVARTMVASALSELTAMATNRLAYDPTEALAFVDQVNASLAAYQARMQSMLGAALGQADVDRIGHKLQLSGMTDFSASPLAFAETAAPSAWRIEARRA